MAKLINMTKVFFPACVWLASSTQHMTSVVGAGWKYLHYFRITFHIPDGRQFDCNQGCAKDCMAVWEISGKQHSHWGDDTVLAIVVILPMGTANWIICYCHCHLEEHRKDYISIRGLSQHRNHLSCSKNQIVMTWSYFYNGDHYGGNTASLYRDESYVLEN